MKTMPFEIRVPDDVLDDLRDRLARTRWPNEAGDGVPGTGPSLPSMRELAAYWADGFDWRAQEDELNAVPHVLATVGADEWHVVHARSEADGAVPILLLHGWADSFMRYRHVIAPLADASASQPFHVVVPSLPAFDFTDQPAAGALSAEAIAQQLGELMTGLGHDRFFVHGGDWGGVVGQEVARAFPERVIGLHLTDIPFPNLYMVDRGEVSDEEREFLAGVDAWGEKDGAYVSIQTTRPLTLSYGLSDSPVGLAAWLRDHFDRLVTNPVSRDDLLTNVMLYWVAGSVRSSMRLYSEGSAWEDDGSGGWDAGGGGEDWAGAAGEAGGEAGAAGGWDASADAGGWDPKIHVPTALQVFPADIAPAPRAFAERFFDVVRYTREPAGGHFAALEVPDAVVADLRAFAASLG